MVKCSIDNNLRNEIIDYLMCTVVQDHYFFEDDVNSALIEKEDTFYHFVGPEKLEDRPG